MKTFRFSLFCALAAFVSQINALAADSNNLSGDAFRGGIPALEFGAIPFTAHLWVPRRGADSAFAEDARHARIALRKLDLTSAQQHEIEAELAQYAERLAAVRSELREAKAHRETAQLNGDAATEEMITAQIETIATRSGMLRSELRRSVLNVLTVEQEEKFNMIQDNLRERNHSRLRS